MSTPHPPAGLRVIGAAEVAAQIDGNREGALAAVRAARTQRTASSRAAGSSNRLELPEKEGDIGAGR